ncbi:MAG TPA: hypothetical protein VF941_22565 [Clostridia bacterium]
MKKALLAFCSGKAFGKKAEEVLGLYQSEGYDIHMTQEINSENFHISLLPDAITSVKKLYDDINIEITVFSDLHEAILLWYRLFNSSVHSFILAHGQNLVNNLFKSIPECRFCMDVAGFYGINSESPEGKILIVPEQNHLGPELFLHIMKSEYFRYFGIFETPMITKNEFKSSIQNKVYLHEGRYYSFSDESYDSTNNNIIDVNKDPNIRFDISEMNLTRIFGYDPYLFAFLVRGIYKNIPANFFKICFNFFHLDKEDISREKLSDILESLIRPSDKFVEKVHMKTWISVLKDRDWIFNEKGYQILSGNSKRAES